MMKKLLMALFHKELQSYAEAHARDLQTNLMQSIAELIKARRQGAMSGSLLGTITGLIDNLEKEEQKRDKYATLVWKLVDLHLEEREWVSKAVSSFDQPR